MSELQGIARFNFREGNLEEFTYTTTFQIMQSLRLDTGLGVSRPVNP